MNIILERLKSALGFGSGYGTDNKLAEYLGINPSTLSTWKTRGSIGDWGLIFEKCKDLDFHWLITGQDLGRSSQIIKIQDIEKEYQEFDDEDHRFIKLPNGTLIEEKRRIFLIPYTRQICDKVVEMDDEFRLKMLQILYILKSTFSRKNNDR